MNFQDFVDFKLDGEDDWSWRSLPYEITGYESAWAEYMGLINIQILELKYGQSVESNLEKLVDWFRECMVMVPLA